MQKMDGTKVNVIVDIRNNIDKNQHRGFIILLLLSRFGDNRMAWQWAETLVEIRGALADIMGTTK